MHGGCSKLGAVDDGLRWQPTAPRDYSSIKVAPVVTHQLGVQSRERLLVVFAVDVMQGAGHSLLASVWDHKHNYLVKLDLALNSQAILYQNGDFEKIIVDVVQVADKAVICDRDRKVKIFVGNVKVHELRHSCFYQGKLF